MVTSVATVVKKFNKRWDVPRFNESLYKPFIKQQLVLRSRETEVIGLTFLFSCVIGKKHIVDSSNDLKQRIQDLKQLALLSRYNVKGKNGKTGKYNNHEIFKIMQRADGAHAYNDDFLNYGEILDNIFGSNSALNFFGKTPSYDEHVRHMKLM